MIGLSWPYLGVLTLERAILQALSNKFLPYLEDRLSTDKAELYPCSSKLTESNIFSTSFKVLGPVLEAQSISLCLSNLGLLNSGGKSSLWVLYLFLSVSANLG